MMWHLICLRLNLFFFPVQTNIEISKMHNSCLLNIKIPHSPRIPDDLVTVGKLSDPVSPPPSKQHEDGEFILPLRLKRSWVIKKKKRNGGKKKMSALINEPPERSSQCSS